jgi:hypothetical protein
MRHATNLRIQPAPDARVRVGVLRFAAEKVMPMCNAGERVPARIPLLTENEYKLVHLAEILVQLHQNVAFLELILRIIIGELIWDKERGGGVQGRLLGGGETHGN